MVLCMLCSAVLVVVAFEAMLFVMYGSSVFSSVLLSLREVRWVWMLCLSCLCLVLELE